MQPKVDWDTEVTQYRRTSKRASVVGVPHNVLRLPPPIPSQLSSLRIDEESTSISRQGVDDDIDDGPSLIGLQKGFPDDTNTLVEDYDADDEEDEDDEGGYVEGDWRVFVSPSDPSAKLYFNVRTQQTSVTAPEGVVVADAALLTRNSSIMADTWAAGERDFARGGAAAGLGALGVGAGASVAPQGKKARELLIERVQDALTEASRHVETLMLPSQDGQQTKQMIDALAVVKKGLQSTIVAMRNVQASSVQESSTIDFLLGIKKIRWDFEGGASIGSGADSVGSRVRTKSVSMLPTAAQVLNISPVDYYRASSQQTNHAKMMFTDYHFPRYYSAQPLPSTMSRASCVVRLFHSLITQTMLSVSTEDTVHAVIVKAVAKLPPNSPGVLEPRQYALKVTGHNEFLVGDDLFFSYAHVRRCVRDQQDIDVSLVRRPDPSTSMAFDPKVAAAAAQAAADYRTKIDRSVPIMTPETHLDVVAAASDPLIDIRDLSALPLSSLQVPFSIKLIGIDNVNPASMPRLTPNICSVFVRACLFHGCQYLEWNHELPPVDLAETLRWDAHLQGGYQVQLSLLPREVRFGFVVVGKRSDNKDKEVPLAWVTGGLVDHLGQLRTGRCELRLWPFPPKEGKKHGKKRDLDPDFLFRATTVDNRGAGANTAVLTVDLPRFALPVVAPLALPYVAPNPRVVGADVRRQLNKEQSQLLVRAIRSDPLYPLTTETRQLLWANRHSLVDDPAALTKVLQCVPWGLQDFRNEAYRLLRLWSPPENPARALELLDARYADYTVRKWAVDQLRRLSDDELQVYLLQLVQCIKFEPFHDSPLSRFLLERALASPYQVGHSFFWHLKAEVHDPLVCERFLLLLEEFLAHAGYYVDELHKQSATVLRLQKIAEMIVHLKREMQYSDADAMREYTKELEKLNSSFFKPMGKFQVPLNPKWEATGLIVEKCRYMSSKMVPLWLVFQNADPNAPPIYVIFKSGDDLRQDLLTLQLLRVMDHMWLANDLDMRLKPYLALATGVNDNGDGVGMIEVVLNSDTTSGIQIKYGGGASGALKLEPIDLFIREHNKDRNSHLQAVDNFVRSCAGYCVATFVLGIGDRHNGNIMVTKSGHLFHIDFGHFLGNFKKKFGVKRERAAFVFTPEMAFVMGGKNYRRHTQFSDFRKLCTHAFTVLRANAPMLENLFLLMVAAGMPELMRESDIVYLREKLNLDLSQPLAVKELQNEIDKSLDSTYRRIDNLIHNFVHG